MRGIRGAICAHDNSKEAIYSATQRLLGEILTRNELRADDIVAAFFTMTPDLNADFPAYAARELGWTDVPMLGAQESLVPGAPERSIRVLVLTASQAPVRPVYLGRAAAMRPDLAEPGDAEMWDGAQADPAPRGEPPLGHLLVVGLGLIGGSLAAAAKDSRLCRSVCGYDGNPAAVATALQRGLIQRPCDDLQAALAEADIVVLAVPVVDIVGLLTGYGSRFKPGAVVTDVGSTKRAIVAAMESLPEGVFAVGGHPVTGGTASGPSAADARLFRGARWAVIETRRSDENALATVERLVRAAGAHPTRMTADLHDKVVAVTSHLPAAMAIGLVEEAGAARAGVDRDAWLVGPGFAGASRLSAGDPTMTAQMLADNADNLRVVIARLIRRLQELRDLAVSDPDSFLDRISEARVARNAMLEDSG